MSNAEHLKRLRAGRKEWNAWRARSGARTDLRGARLEYSNLYRFDLSNADMRRAKLRGTHLREADLEGADLRDAWAGFAVLSRAKLAGAQLTRADLRCASLRRADLTGANLDETVLRFTSMVEATVEGATLRKAQVYGISAWGLKGEPADQSEMLIQADSKSLITTVDDLDTAQLLFLLRDNPKIADVIETASQRVVLLLGRFAPRRKRVLDGIKDHLLRRNFVPVLFNFEKPKGRDLTETVASLAHMACFVVADLSGAKSIPQELSFIVPYLPSVPVMPLLVESDDRPYAMFEHFQRYPWVHGILRYRDLNHLLEIFDTKVLKPAYREAMASRGVANVRLPRTPKQP
ncbi:MAG: pentapeptide repeat-containing protein [bacterium]|nr:pentapeptide repeat-containing protein [bacterium]